MRVACPTYNARACERIAARYREYQRVPCERPFARAGDYLSWNFAIGMPRHAAHYRPFVFFPAKSCWNLPPEK